MFKLLKTLFFGKEREVPEGYVLQKNVMGRQIAKGNCGTICWIPSRRTQNGMEIQGFWKKIEALYVVERNGHSRKMRENEIYSWRMYFEE